MSAIKEVTRCPLASACVHMDMCCPQNRGADGDGCRPSVPFLSCLVQDCSPQNSNSHSKVALPPSTQSRYAQRLLKLFLRQWGFLLRCQAAGQPPPPGGAGPRSALLFSLWHQAERSQASPLGSLMWASSHLGFIFSSANGNHLVICRAGDGGGKGSVAKFVVDTGQGET